MFTRHHRTSRLLLGLADILLTVVAFELAYRTRLALTLERDFSIPPDRKLLLTLFSILVFVSLGFWMRIYERARSRRPLTLLADAVRQSAVAGVAIVVFEYALRLDLSRPFLALFLFYGAILAALFRAGAMTVSRRLRPSPHYVMVVGTGEAARRMGRLLEEAASQGVCLNGFFSSETPAPHVVELRAEYAVHPIGRLPGLLRERVIDEIVFAPDTRDISALEDVFLLCDEEGVRTSVAVDFFPHVHSTAYLDRLGPAPLLTFSATPHDEVRLMLKRAIDITVSAAALTVLSPLFLAVALVIKATSAGPVIFRQERCGLNGRRFICLKFRSMIENAEEMKASLAHLNEKTTVFKIANDPRLTPAGRWLRKFSIDEWPQLWNVLRGDMSLVGPRPAVPSEVERYERWQRRRLRMRPGLTCLWALAGRDSLDFESWMKMDMQYIDNWSLGLDWSILLRTIPHVVTGRGAH
ncbi:MAG TPA: sugar transferase [Solibacterales bacterium]|nr:sugar transferase [Bryobacterales bacterium]